MRTQKKSAGFTLIEIVVGITVIGLALGMVGAARQKKETVKKQVQTSIEQAAQTRSKLEEPTREIPKKEPEADVKKDAPRLSKEPTTDERKEKRPQASSGGKDSQGQPYVPVYDYYYEEQRRQQEEAATYYQQQQEAQQQLYEQYYYYEQQQQGMFDPNQFMQDPYQQYNPVLQDFYQQMLPGVYQQFFP